jgi:O-antigen biosynthesis protein
MSEPDHPAAALVLPIVCIFGATGISLNSAPSALPYETIALDCRCFADDHDLEVALIAHRPHVIVSFGVLGAFTNLNAAPFEVRRRWLHFDSADDLVAVGQAAFNCYLAVCLDPRPDVPLVSVITPTYRTGARLQRAYESLRRQTYRNWQWVLLDDSDDGGETYDAIRAIAATDHRVCANRRASHSGVIGAVKYETAMLSTGALIAELDHDDALTPRALEYVVATSLRHDRAGFFFSDCAEVDAELRPLRYADGWGYGYGGYRAEPYDGTMLWVAEAPNINPKTIRALVSCPNHIRVWRRALYFELGGHNRLLHVADDFDLLIRTFLTTRMVRIPALCYLQFHEGANAQTMRNADIQRHVRYLRWKYDKAIHQRLLQLGVCDWVWDERRQCSDLNTPNPPDEQAVSVTATFEA